jgi:uridine kinase
MNVIEAYTKFRGQLIIIISGLSGCGKTTIAKELSDDLKLKFIDQHDYYIKDYDTKEILSDGTEIINYDTDDAIDWEKLNNDINDKKNVIISGFSFPTEKIKFKSDYHIHLKISKQKCLEQRKQFLENDDKKTTIETLKFNKFTFPYYLSSVEKSKIDKFININEISDQEISDAIFNWIVESVEIWLYKIKDKTKEPIKENSMKNPKKNNIPKREEADYTFVFETVKPPKSTYDRELDMMRDLYKPPSDSETSASSSDIIKNGPIMIDTQKNISKYFKI